MLTTTLDHTDKLPLTETVKGIRCRKRPDGKFVPTCSAVLDLLFPEQGNWISTDDLERGERCHQWIANWLLRRQMDMSDPPPLKAPSEALACTNLALWIIERQLKTLHVEQSLFSPAGDWSGTPDNVAQSGNTLLAIDWKFSVSIQERFKVQAQAYRHLIPGSRASLVQVTANGVKEHRLTPNPHHFAAFQSAVNVLNWRLKP